MADRYAVFGNPIQQSLSPQIHLSFAAQTGELIDYQRQLVATDGFAAAVSDFFDAGGAGLNVTAPFKLEAFDLSDCLTERAECAGAVNTLYLSDRSIMGDNTDGVGLCADLSENLHWNLEGARILVLGAGGAVRGVLRPLLERRPATLTLTNRTVSKAEQLALEFSTYTEATSLTASAFQTIDTPYDIVINGTSTSLSSDLPPLSPIAVNNANCYDMAYGSRPTRFIEWALAQGAHQAVDGLGMLVEQAAEAFFIWRGVRPETREVIEQIRASL